MTIMAKTNQDKARQRRAATVEYVAFAFDDCGLFTDSVRFLSTPVIHVNGPGLLRFKCINSSFVQSFNRAIETAFDEWPTEATIFRVDPDGYMRAVLRWIPQAREEHNAVWNCIRHEDCWLQERNYGW